MPLFIAILFLHPKFPFLSQQFFFGWEFSLLVFLSSSTFLCKQELSYLYCHVCILTFKPYNIYYLTLLIFSFMSTFANSSEAGNSIYLKNTLTSNFFEMSCVSCYFLSAKTTLIYRHKHEFTLTITMWCPITASFTLLFYVTSRYTIVASKHIIRPHSISTSE